MAANAGMIMCKPTQMTVVAGIAMSVCAVGDVKIDRSLGTQVDSPGGQRRGQKRPVIVGPLVCCGGAGSAGGSRGRSCGAAAVCPACMQTCSPAGFAAAELLQKQHSLVCVLRASA